MWEEKRFGYLLLRHFFGFVGCVNHIKKNWIWRFETAQLSYCLWLFFTKNTLLMISTNISWLLFVIKAANPTIIETLKEIASWSSKREKNEGVIKSFLRFDTQGEKKQVALSRWKKMPKWDKIDVHWQTLLQNSASVRNGL